MTELLTAGELSVYADFASYFVMLGLPIILLSLAAITGFHFWNRRKQKRSLAGNDAVTTPDLPVASVPLPPLTAVERQHVINKIRRQLSGCRARNVALRHDFLVYQKKRSGDNNSSTIKTVSMENFEEKIAAYEKQIAEMQNKIDMLETMPPPLNNEAHYLREMLAEKDKEISILRNVNGHGVVIEERPASSASADNLLNEQQQEIHRLKSLIHEQEHVNDLLYESREQVNFLQNQLEQRIKSAKVLEQRIASVSSELTQAQFEFHEAGKKILKTEEVLEEKDREIGQIRLQVDGKDNEVQHLQAELNGKNEQMIAMERALNELKQEIELNNTAISNNRETILSFTDQIRALSEENGQLKDLLRKNKNILYRLYKEINSSVGEEENEEQHAEVA